MSARRAGLLRLMPLVCSGGEAGAWQATVRHPTRFGGEDRARFSRREQRLSVSDVLARTTAKPTRGSGMAIAHGSAYDSAAVASGSIEKMRAGQVLQCRVAPSAYPAQVDDG